MRILGARLGDIVRCVYWHDEEACERVVTGYYLWPRLWDIFEELEPIPLPVPPIPGPDPPPELLQELTAVLLASHFGVQPSLPSGARLQATIKFRDRLQQLVSELDEEIEELQQGRQAQS